MIGLYPIIRRVRRPLMPVDMEPPTAFVVPVKQVAPVPFEDYLLANYGANLKAFLPLAFDIKDQSAGGN